MPKTEEYHTKMLLLPRTFLNHFKIWHRCIQIMDKVHFFLKLELRSIVLHAGFCYLLR